MRALVDGAEKQARKILTKHLDKLKKLAEALLEEESLSARQVYDLLGIEQKPALEFDDDEDEEAKEEAADKTDEPGADGIPEESGEEVGLGGPE